MHYNRIAVCTGIHTHTKMLLHTHTHQRYTAHRPVYESVPPLSCVLELAVVSRSKNSQLASILINQELDVNRYVSKCYIFIATYKSKAKQALIFRNSSLAFAHLQVNLTYYFVAKKLAYYSQIQKSKKICPYDFNKSQHVRVHKMIVILGQCK